MGLFDKFKEYKESRKVKRIERATKLVKNPKAIKDDRWEALQFLSQLDTPIEGVKPLLNRFEYSLEHGINDSKEKDLALSGIEKAGEPAISIITEHLKNTSRIAWPIKALNLLADEKTIIESLRSVLTFSDTSFDQATIDKNYDILCYLRDYKLDSEQISVFKRFLEDSDERVRFACCECLVAQNNEKIAQELLEPFLKDDTVENSRIKQAVMTSFLENKWKLSNPEVFEGGEVHPGVKVDSDGMLRAS